MERQVYITEEERAKCKRVADAFAELYEVADIVVIDVGRYGFAELKYYMSPHGFEEDGTMKLYLMAKATPLLESGYKSVFESLSKEKQPTLIGQKADFVKLAGISL